MTSVSFSAPGHLVESEINLGFGDDVAAAHAARAAFKAAYVEHTNDTYSLVVQRGVDSIAVDVAKVTKVTA
jgi:hypothetical protein